MTRAFDTIAAAGLLVAAIYQWVAEGDSTTAAAFIALAGVLANKVNLDRHKKEDHNGTT